MRNCLFTVGSVSLVFALYGAAYAQNAQAPESTDERKSPVLTRVESTPIPAPTLYEFSRSVGPGRLLKKSNGTDGEVRRTYTVSFENGKKVKTLIGEDRTDPQPAIFLMGRNGYQPSRGSFTRSRVIEMAASAYPPRPSRNSRGRTASGMKATFGLVAVDPRVIPLGTHLYIEGYGFALAADTGGAIKGKRIDLCYSTWGEASRFGRRKVRVHVLKA